MTPMTPVLTSRTLPHQPTRPCVPPSGLAVDAAWQVALSVEVPPVEPPLEDQGRSKGSGMVVAHLIPSMSMAMDETLDTVVALFYPPMS